MSNDLPEAPKRYKCGECDHVCGEPLIAPNPFDPTWNISGCPSCKSVETMLYACQVEGCDEHSTSGVPGAYGYRYAWLCGDHYLEWTRRKT